MVRQRASLLLYSHDNASMCQDKSKQTIVILNKPDFSIHKGPLFSILWELWWWWWTVRTIGKSVLIRCALRRLLLLRCQVWYEMYDVDSRRCNENRGGFVIKKRSLVNFYSFFFLFFLFKEEENDVTFLIF